MVVLTKVTVKYFRKDWKPQHLDCFKKVKRMISQGVMLKCLDKNNNYLIHTNASNYQLGTVIYEDKLPIDSSRNLTRYISHYLDSDKEALCIKEVHY